MALPLPLADFFCGEHRYKPLPPSILLLGRQTVPFGVETLERLAAKWGLPPPDAALDRATLQARANPDGGWITDASFFAMLGVREIRAIDHSDYEGADIILDICQPIPADLEGRFDFVFNGSVLDNVHDPATALRNIGRLVAPGGRVVHIETATTSRYSYAALSPSWFFDWAVVNGWTDCKVYMGSTRNWEGLTAGPWGMMGFDPTAQARPNAFTCDLGAELGVQVVIAEKGFGSTCDRTPTQAHYRSDADWERFQSLLGPIRSSRRPLHLGAGGAGEPIASFEGAWRSCGWW